MEEIRTLVWADLVDSTAAHAQLGERLATQWWLEHDQRSRELLIRWGGTEIKRSDGFLALFDEPARGARFLAEYHAMLDGMSVRMLARAAIHTGAVEVRRRAAPGSQPGEAVEVLGLGKAICARLLGLAAGGQTLAGAAAAVGLRAEGVACHSHGFWRLKGIDEPLEVFEVDRPNAPYAGAPPGSDKAYRVVAGTHGHWHAVSEVPRDLPAEVDAFFGRHDEALRLARLASERRLVTVLGTAGVGKTRLVLRHAWGWMGDFPGGVYFCDLLVAADADGIARAAARALGVPLGAEPIPQLGDVIAARGPCLMILDNFEHVTAHAQATLGHWLNAAPAAHFVVTSRERLGLQGEHALLLNPLPSAEAIALFHERARAAHGGYEPVAPASVMEQLVRLLDGLPLAIELAAARASIVPPEGLVRLMGERFKLLAARGRPDRQATLSAALEWSWDLLSPPERSALAQLSVFVGSFTAAAAEATLDLSEVDAGRWVVDLLQLLVDKSLLRAVGGGRFRLLQCIREFAADKLARGTSARASPGPSTVGGDGPVAAAAARRHHRYFAGLSEAEAVADGCIELDNLVSACRGACADGDAADAVDCIRLAWLALRLVGPFHTAVDLADEVQRLALQPHQQAAVDWVRGAALYVAGEAARAQQALEQGLAAAPAGDDRLLLARLNCSLGELLSVRGKPAEARRLLEAAHGHARASGDVGALCQVLNARGSLAMDEGRAEEARELYGQALRVAEASGDRRWQAAVLANLGLLLMDAGRYDESIVANQRALENATSSGDLRWTGNVRCNLGLIFYEKDRLTEAEEQLQQALDAAHRLGDRMLGFISLCNLGLVSEKRGDLEQARQRHQAAIEGAHGAGDVRMEAQMRACLGSVLARLSRWDEGRECLSAASRLLAPNGDGLSRGLVLCSVVENEWLSGQPGAARCALDQAVQLLRECGDDPTSQLGRRVAAVSRLASVAGEA